MNYFFQWWSFQCWTKRPIFVEQCKKKSLVMVNDVDETIPPSGSHFRS